MLSAGVMPAPIGIFFGIVAGDTCGSGLGTCGNHTGGC